MKTKAQAHIIRVALINAGQIIGHEDVLTNRNYTTTVKSVSNDAVLYYCNKEEFNALMKRDDKTWQLLMDMCNQKDLNTRMKITKARKTFRINNYNQKDVNSNHSG